MSRKKDLIYFVISKTNPNSEHISLIRTFEILILKVCEDVFFPFSAHTEVPQKELPLHVSYSIWCPVTIALNLKKTLSYIEYILHVADFYSVLLGHLVNS